MPHRSCSTACNIGCGWVIDLLLAFHTQGGIDMVPDMVKQFVVYFYRHIR